MSALAGALPVSVLSSASSTGANAASNPGSTGTGGSGTALPTPIQHVFLIMMENEQTGVIYPNQPYETQLANTYGWGGNANSQNNGTGYYAACHPSAPNYLAITSGQTLQCNSDGYSTYSVNNLGNLLQTAGESWVAYEESAQVPCQEHNSGLYVVRHNPFPYYSDLGGTTPSSACMTHVLPIKNLTRDYPYTATPPAFTYIAPNILNDGHSSSAATGDYWLSTFIPNLIAQPWFSSTAIFIVYDEAYEANGTENFTGYDGLVGGPVYMVAASPYTAGIGALGYNATHYNTLSTIEWLLGLPATGAGLDGTSAFPVLTSLFQPQIFGPGVNLRYTDLPAADLKGLNLRDDDLQYANLAGADLQGSDLQGADLEFANLTGADLQGANLEHANLAGAELQRADLRGSSLQYADLAGADLRHADLRASSLEYADLQGANLRAAKLPGAQLEYADMASALLTGFGPTTSLATNFNAADLYQAILTGALCGSPNYITAAGANINAVGVPATCEPPL
jgi:phosphatidylinositol-3-phosphatase